MVMRVLMPGVTLVCFVVVAVAPLGLSAENRILAVMPLLASVHYWALRYEGAVSEYGAFVAGLGVDVLGGGPLGLWALVGLSVYVIATLSRPLRGVTSIGRWGLFGLAVAGALLVFALLGAGVLGQSVDFAALGWALLAAMAGYPAVALCLRLIDGLRVGERHRLARAMS